MKLHWICLLIQLISFVGLRANERPPNYYIQVKADLLTIEIGRYNEKGTKEKAIYASPIDSLNKKKFTSLFGFTNDSSELLIYLHCWLGNEPHFHERTLNGLIEDSRNSKIKNFVSILWPSDKAGYLTNSKNAQAKGKVIAPLLMWLASMFPEKTNLLCHSMGNEVLGGAMHELDEQKNTDTLFNELILAAADVNEHAFSQQFKNLPKRAQRIHILIHKNDRLLKISSKLHGENRLGLNGPAATDSVLLKHKNILIADASHTFSLRRPDPSNHIYFHWNPTVRLHLRKMLDHRLIPHSFPQQKVVLSP